MDHEERPAGAGSDGVPDPRGADVPALRDLDDRLGALDELPLDEHPRAFDDMHRQLVAALDDIGDRSAALAERPRQVPLPGPPGR